MHRTSKAIMVDATLERRPLRYPFRITGYEWTQTEVLVLKVEQNGLRGRGEACGIYSKNDTAESGLAQVREVANAIAERARRADRPRGRPRRIRIGYSDRSGRSAQSIDDLVAVGNMSGTSLAMAPAFLLGQRCDDLGNLDGPLVLLRDRKAGVRYEGGCISCPEQVWGGETIR